MIPRRRHGFTMIELLIVIAIMATVIALAVPAIMKARQGAMRTQGGNNLKQIGLAFHGFHDAHKRLPFPGGLTANVLANNPALGDPRTGTWAYQILPFVDQVELFNAPPSVPGGRNAHHRTASVPVFMCPARGRRPYGQTGFANCPQAAWSDYVINGLINDPITDEKENKTIGVVTVPEPTIDDPNPNGDNKRTLKWITDHPCFTILVGQGMIQRGDWSNPGDASAPDGAMQCSDIYLLSAANAPGPVTNNRLSRSVGPWDPAMGAYPVVVQPDVPGLSDNDTTKWGGPFPQYTLVVFADGVVRHLYLNAEGGNISKISRVGVGEPWKFSHMYTPNGGEPNLLGDY